MPPSPIQLSAHFYPFELTLSLSWRLIVPIAYWLSEGVFSRLKNGQSNSIG